MAGQVDTIVQSFHEGSNTRMGVRERCILLFALRYMREVLVCVPQHVHIFSEFIVVPSVDEILKFLGDRAIDRMPFSGIVVKNGWHRRCHRNPSSFRLIVHMFCIVSLC